jgi:hypothetical protein
MAYDSNWRQAALNAGQDQNSPQFAEQRTAEASYSGGGGSSLGNGGNVFNAAKSALQQRYDALIQGINTNTGQQINRQTVTTNNEMGKRGILPSSGLAQQEMTNALNPINQQSSVQMAGAQADYNSGIANLALQQYQGQQAEQQNTFNNNIAQQTLDLQKLSGNKPSTQIIEVGNKKYLINTQTGQVISDYSKEASNGINNYVGANNIPLKSDGTPYKNSQGQTFTDQTKMPTETFIGKDGKTYQRYSNGTWGTTLWS